jgi:hypothetical protein
MRSRPRVAIVGALAAIVALLLASASASAAGPVEFGNTCTPNLQLPPVGSVVESVSLTTGVGNVPVPGVITSWKVKVVTDDPVPVPTAFRLQVWRPVLGLPNLYTLQGQSEPELPDGPEGTFATRVPVLPGDVIGLLASGGYNLTSYCEGEAEAARLAVLPGSTAPGETAAEIEGVEPAELPVVVSIEPDLDHDGFGDLTQDFCPTDPSTQAACPGPAAPAPAPPASSPPPASVPKLVLHPVLHRGGTTLQVSTEAAASVTVTARAALGGGRAARFGAPSQSLAAGATGSFPLRFPRPLRERLAELRPGQAVRLRLLVTTRRADGTVEVRHRTVVLHRTA